MTTLPCAFSEQFSIPVATGGVGRRQIPTYIEVSPPQSFPTVRWDVSSPGRITAEHQLHLLDQDMRRLAMEMNRLQREAGVSVPPPAPSASDFEPKTFSSDLFTTGSSGAHAESWRKKENFHLDNPVVMGRDGQKEFRLEFDLRQFRPEEIKVSTEGQLLTVQAQHMENESGKQVRREYFRQFTLPDNIDPITLISRQSQSGILSVFAPLPVDTDTHSISITRK